MEARRLALACVSRRGATCCLEGDGALGRGSCGHGERWLTRSPGPTGVHRRPDTRRPVLRPPLGGLQPVASCLSTTSCRHANTHTHIHRALTHLIRGQLLTWASLLLSRTQSYCSLSRPRDAAVNGRAGVRRRIAKPNRPDCPAASSCRPHPSHR